MFCNSFFVCTVVVVKQWKKVKKLIKKMDFCLLQKKRVFFLDLCCFFVQQQKHKIKMQTFKFTLTNWNSCSSFFPLQLMPTCCSSVSLYPSPHSFNARATKTAKFLKNMLHCAQFLFIFSTVWEIASNKTHEFTQKHYFSAKSVVVNVVVVADSFSFSFTSAKQLFPSDFSYRWASVD